MPELRKKRIILVVTNDLEGDQRLHKMAASLQKMEFEPVIIGRLLPNSKPLSRDYSTRRIKLLFKKGAAFYACFNIRIFFYLLFIKADLFVANDLDTLSGVWLAAKIRRMQLVYDSHEYFTEVPELVNRKNVQSFWRMLERKMQPGICNVITVNESIANIFRQKYKQEVTVIKNLPLAQRPYIVAGHLPEGFTGKPIIIYQGAVNLGRGIEQLVKAMHLLPDFNLLIVGGGDLLEQIRKLVVDEGLTASIHLTGRVPMEAIPWYTKQAQIGVSLEQDIGLNYRLSLPNKLFDYMQAGLPVVASDLPEISRIVREVGYGILISEYTPEAISESIHGLIRDKELFKLCKERALAAADNYTWDKQEDELVKFYKKALGITSGLPM